MIGMLACISSYEYEARRSTGIIIRGNESLCTTARIVGQCERLSGDVKAAASGEISQIAVPEVVRATAPQKQEHECLLDSCEEE